MVIKSYSDESCQNLILFVKGKPIKVYCKCPVRAYGLCFPTLLFFLKVVKNIFINMYRIATKLAQKN